MLDTYGRYLNIDGRRTPAWLIADGADASAEAVLGLASTSAPVATAARSAVLTQLSDGIAEISGGNARTWPFGGVLPWTPSRPTGTPGGRRCPLRWRARPTPPVTGHGAAVAQRDAFTFDPWMLTSGGPDNGRLPDTRRRHPDRLRRRLPRPEPPCHRRRCSPARRSRGRVVLRGKRVQAPTYDPATGITFDGVAPDGKANQNSGAESTIHGLLTMIALDGDPAAKRIAMTAAVQQVGTEYVQAEDSQLGGGATAVKPKTTWTGESQYAGTGYAALGDQAPRLSISLITRMRWSCPWSTCAGAVPRGDHLPLR